MVKNSILDQSTARDFIVVITIKTLCFFEVFLIKFLPFVSDIQRRVFSTPAPIVVSTTITTVLPKAPSVVPKRSSVVPKRTSVVPNVTVRPQTSYTVVSTNSPKPEFVSTNSPNTFPIFVSTKLPSSSPIFVSTKLPEKSSNNLLSSQPGILLGDAQLPDFIPVSTAAPSGSDEISHSLGASGFKGVQFVKSQSDNNPRHRELKLDGAKGDFANFRSLWSGL